MRDNAVGVQVDPVNYREHEQLWVTKEHNSSNKIKMNKLLGDKWLDNLFHPMDFIVSQIHKWFI